MDLALFSFSTSKTISPGAGTYGIPTIRTASPGKASLRFYPLSSIIVLALKLWFPMINIAFCFKIPFYIIIVIAFNPYLVWLAYKTLAYVNPLKVAVAFLV